MKTQQNGFAAIEALLIVIIVAIVGGTGWFVWRAKQNANDSLSNAANSQQGIVKASKVTDFASCKAAKGSVMQETFPEKCVTKDGKSFTDTSSQPAQSKGGVQATPFTGLPADLKATVLANAACASNGQLLNEAGQPDTGQDYYVANSTAFVGQCQAQAFYAYVSGQWKFVAKTQYGFDCAQLRQYSTPVALVAAALPNGTCVSNPTTGDQVTYQL